MANKKYVDELIVKAESYDIVDVGARDLIDKHDVEINAIKGKISSNATSENKLVSVKDISSTVFSNYGILTKLDANNDGDLIYNGKVVGKVTSIKGDNEETYRTGNVNITKDNIGLGNVENYKSVSVSANQGLTDTEKSNARANIGAGTSSFSGSYNDLTNKPSSFTPSSHTHDYLPLSGGAMTGNIKYKGSKNTYDAIKFIDNTADAYGNGISIGAGGLTIIGGGESSDTVAAQQTSGGDEKMIIANDQEIDFYTNTQSGFSSAKHITMNTDGTITAAGFNGTATKATQDASGNVIIDTYATKTALSSGLAGKSNTGHTHDDRYYTESEINTKLSGKANKITYITLANFNALSKKDANTLYVITG